MEDKINKVIAVLINSEFNPELKEFDTYYDIRFLSFGWENFKIKEMDIIRNICGKSLMEFYYGYNMQHIFIHKNVRKLKLEKITAS